VNFTAPTSTNLCKTTLGFLNVTVFLLSSASPYHARIDCSG